MRVCVSGIGIVSAIGIGVEQNLTSVKSLRDGMGQMTLFDTIHSMPFAQVKASNGALKEQLALPQNKAYSRTALLGMLAAKEAIDDANLDFERFRIGVVSATSTGGMDRTENFYKEFSNNHSKGRLRDVVSHLCSDSTDKIAQYCGIKGYSTTISTACSSAANAIMFGARLIKNGYLDAVLVGGTDALCKFTINGFNSLMILDSEKCRPFDNSRGGLNLGEGAGYLILQREDTLKGRHYCSLSGYANANDAFHQTASTATGEGAYLAMSNALTMSGILPENIDYLNVHGTGTQNNDLSEGVAIKRIWGEKTPLFSSTKPFTGHTLAAAAGVEAVFSVLAIDRGILYPNLNFKEPIPEIGLIPQTEYKEGLAIQSVMSNSFGFGGNNSSLIFTK